MQPAITSAIVVAYAQCPRKAYLLLCSPEQGTPHEYVRILERQRRAHQARYLNGLQHTHADVHPYTVEHLHHGRTVLLHACLQADGLAAACDVLTRVERSSLAGTPRYTPTLCVGTYSVSPEQKLVLAFAGYVLGYLQPPPSLDASVRWMGLLIPSNSPRVLRTSCHAWNPSKPGRGALYRRPLPSS